MKKLIFVLPIALLLLALSLTPATASVDWEDPTLCIAGQWLVINAGNPAAITVFVPEGTRYGDQAAGGCAASGLSVPLIQNVQTRGNGHSFNVQMSGLDASVPTVTVTYGNSSETKKNDAKGLIMFHFALP